MTTFPTIQSPNGITQSIVKKVFYNKSSVGYHSVRDKAVVSKMEFSISYQALTSEEMNVMQFFFNTYQGSNFDWTHPEQGGTTYTVGFADDVLAFNWLAADYWSLELKIKEV